MRAFHHEARLLWLIAAVSLWPTTAYSQWTMPSSTLMCYTYDLGYNIDLRSLPPCSTAVSGFSFRRTFIAAASCIDCKNTSKVAFPTATIVATAGLIEPCPNAIFVLFTGSMQSGSPPYVFATLQAAATGSSPYIAQTSQDCNLNTGSTGTGVELPCGVIVD
jgi:hypothetical protein